MLDSEKLLKLVISLELIVYGLILDLLLTSIVLGVTTIVGASLVFGFSHCGSWLTKMALSFCMGFIVISVTGIISNLIKIDPFLAELTIVLICVVLSLKYKREILEGPEKKDLLVLGLGAFYIVFCLAFFDHIIMWMAGDAVAHASIIRMLMDGKALPISFPPFGSYWEYYPKAFHFYSFLWAKVFPIINIIQVVPVIISAATPILLYSLVREIDSLETATYAFVLACFSFPAHYSYLIWAGYPTAAAEMLLIAALISMMVDLKLMPLLLLGIALTHPRLLVLAIAVLIIWIIFRLAEERGFRLILALLVLLILVPLVLGNTSHSFLLSFLAERQLIGEYAARWYPAFLALFGFAIALFRRGNMDRLIIIWTVISLALVALTDIGASLSISSTERAFLNLYLPLSALAAIAFTQMDGAQVKLRAIFLSILLLVGFASMFAVFQFYANSWALPVADYDAMNWLESQNMTEAICLNLDETGAWIYPITGMEVARPRFIPRGNSSFNSKFIQNVVRNPQKNSVLEKLEKSKYKNILVYISSISLSRPAYVPPFYEFRAIYPNVNLSYSKRNYDLIYNQSVNIYKFLHN
jgi:hypothetical protein